MINFKALASGSKGNCYRISDGESTLLIECGLPFHAIRQALLFGLSTIDGVLVSHSHLDHCRAANKITKAGVDVYMSQGTIDALGLSGHRIKPIKSKEQLMIGTWRIVPFDVTHDAPEPLSFIMANRLGERLLYVTDTPYIKYRFSEHISIIAIECNHSSEILSESVKAGITPRAVRQRVIQSHFSLKNVKEFLRVTDTSRLREIHLLHLSDSNANAEQFKCEIQELCGKEVYIAG